MDFNKSKESEVLMPATRAVQTNCVRMFNFVNNYELCGYLMHHIDDEELLK